MTSEELAARIQAGDDVPGNMLKLWEQTRAFIHTAAIRYQGLADLEDLEQEGYIALYDAVDGYSPEKGCKFLTYAEYWIRRRMRQYIDDCCRPVRIPPHERKRISEYRKMESAFLAWEGRKPTEWEITHNMDLDDGQLRDREGRTIRETGKALGLTVDRVRSMEFKALQELRWGSRLRAFLPEELEAQAYRHNGIREFNRTWESSTERVAMKLW